MVLSSHWTTLATFQIQEYLEQLAKGHALQTSFSGSPEEDIYTYAKYSSFLPTSDIYIYDELISTNQTLWELIQQGAKAGTVAIAHQQSAGKGQWGRQWDSSLGGLYLSLALEPNLPVQQSPHLILSTVCGIALALHSCQLPVAIKWPNDLVVEMPLGSSSSLYKLGGILTETHINDQTINQAVIGIGLNGANPVPDPGINLIDLWSKLRGNRPQPPLLNSLNGLAAIAIYGICFGWHKLQKEGIGAILRDYNQLLVYRNRLVQIEWQRHLQWVRILGVTEAGYLRVRPENAGKKLTGTLPTVSSSIEEIQIPTGTIRLGYDKVYRRTG
ncbi:MAG: biotin--[acetyl-CoA-carboxylase] ligase [Cyanobacteria bacterium P01_F01_bin.150]